jgi:hypothetical protein
MMRSAIQRKAVGHSTILQLRPKTQHRDALRITIGLQVLHEGCHDPLVHVSIIAQEMQARGVTLITIANSEVDGKRAVDFEAGSHSIEQGDFVIKRAGVNAHLERAAAGGKKQRPIGDCCLT